MAITQAMCTSFKKELFEAVHDLTSGGDTIKLALYGESAELGPDTTAYTTTGEITDGAYTTGGYALTMVDPTTSGTTAIVDIVDLTVAATTLSARAGLIYNSSKANRAIAVLDFGSLRTNAQPDFQITFPAADASSAILRIG